MNSAELKTEIADRTARIAPQLRKIRALKLQHRHAVSREWISENQVRASQVHLSYGDDMPQFARAEDFGKWLYQTGCVLPWAEGEGRIYPSNQLKWGQKRRGMALFYEHVAIELPQVSLIAGPASK